MLEMQLRVYGKVQKVGYRVSILRFVENHVPELKGYVRNMPDGSVEIVAQSTDIEELKLLHEFGHKGSSYSEVRHIEYVMKPIERFSYQAFDILG